MQISWKLLLENGADPSLRDPAVWERVAQLRWEDGMLVLTEKELETCLDNAHCSVWFNAFKEDLIHAVYLVEVKAAWETNAFKPEYLNAWINVDGHKGPWLYSLLRILSQSSENFVIRQLFEHHAIYTWEQLAVNEDFDPSK
jgi:hypothetical protein